MNPPALLTSCLSRKTFADSGSGLAKVFFDCYIRKVFADGRDGKLRVNRLGDRVLLEASSSLLQKRSKIRGKC